MMRLSMSYITKTGREIGSDVNFVTMLVIPKTDIESESV